MEISGIDELRQRYSSEFEVELGATLRDGKPAALRLRQLKPLVFIAMANGLPIPRPAPPGERKMLTPDQVAYIKRVVARAISSIREVARPSPEAEWEERWTPIEVVADRDPVEGKEPRELHVDDFDFGDTIIRVWNSLFKQANHGGEMGGTEGLPFRAGDAGGGGDRRENVRKVASRVGTRKVR